MKFIHLSDLHIGKRVNDFSMLEDQEYIFNQIQSTITREKVEGVLIAGDIYDKAVPSAEAVQLFDDFLTELAVKKLPVFLIYGNHDSPERLAFAADLLKHSNVYVSPVYNGKIEPIVLEDAHGELAVYLLPFLKPAYVKHAFPEAEVGSYEEAVSYALSQISVDTDRRNLIVAHQFVTGATVCDSEELSIGGQDNISASLFADFDYVALGHIHGPQHIEQETVRYCGTPLKYSFSEVNHKKSATIIELKEKGIVELTTVPLIPKRDMRKIKGTYLEVTSKSFYENSNTEDYLHITLTDEEDVPDAMGKLRSIYPNLMKLEYDNKRTRENQSIDQCGEMEEKSPLELFQEFYALQNNQEMTEEQNQFIKNLMENIWEEM